MSGRARVYLALAVVGAIAPLALTGVFIAQEGVDLAEAGDQLFPSTVAVLVATDLTLSGLAFLVWLTGEAPRAGLKWWPFLLATLFVGVCFALPLFLYLRERRLTPVGAG